MFNISLPIPRLASQPAEQWQPYPIEDFSGGLNTSEPSASIRRDQQTALSNYYHQPNRTIITRGPFRPWLVASEDTVLPDSAPPLTFIVVELRGSDFRVASWDSGSNIEVSVYDETNDRWAGEGGGTSIKTNLTDGYIPRFVKYSINDAEDLIFCNGKDTPQRWVGTVDTASTDLGLAIPIDAHLAISTVSAANPGKVTTTTAHGFSNGDVISIDGVVGNMGDDVLNDNSFTVTVVDADEFTIGASTAGKTYTSGGVVHTLGILTTGASTAGGRGIELNGTYSYKLTFEYDDGGTSTKFGESGPAVNHSIAVTGAATATPQKVTLLAFTFPTGVSAVNLYRSPADTPTGPYRLVGTNSTTETDFDDVTPVGEEGVEIPADAGTPPKLKNPMVYDERIWGIGLTAAGALSNKGVYTNQGMPDMFPALNFIYFPHTLIGPKLFNKDVYWFTEEQVWVTAGGDVTATPKAIKVCDIGCDSFDSIVDVGNGLVWQYNGNIYWANFNSFNPQTGELPWPIGDPIRDKIGKKYGIPTAQRANSAGEFHADRYYLSITGPNQTFNTATVVWDVKHGTRFLFQGLTGGWSTVSWAANDLQSFDGTLYTADNTNKYLMEHDFAGSADFLDKTDYDATTSQNLATQYTSGDIFFGHEAAQKLVNSLSIVVKSSGVTLETTTSFNGNTFQRTKQFVLGTGSVAIDNSWLIWGQGTWGNFNWGSTSFALQNAHKKIGKGGKGINAKLNVESSNSQDTNLIALKLYHKLLPSPS